MFGTVHAVSIRKLWAARYIVLARPMYGEDTYDGNYGCGIGGNVPY